MFDTISKGFRNAREKLTGTAELTEEVVDSALREVRVSLLEADVEFGVVKQFLADVKSRAVGEKVRLTAQKDGNQLKVSPQDHFIRLCHEALIDLMGPSGTELTIAQAKPTGIMMVGLQGSGKTTTTGKLAKKLQKEGHSVLLVAADIYRPAAVEQLKVLGQSLDLPVFALEGANPVQICEQAKAKALQEGSDVIIYDTAGRVVVDSALMEELAQIHAKVQPNNTLLVIDGMIGQEAVTTAKAFDERLDLSGVVLTKLDGDARGGAALSVKAATGKPILFLGMGETLDKLDAFRPEGLASRILGMGDIVGLMQDFQEVVDEEQAAQDAEKMLGGNFTMDDFLAQIRNLQKMGSMKDLMQKLPIGQLFGGQVPDEVMEKAGDDGELVKVEAIIQSMTKAERKDPSIFLDDGTQKKAHRFAKTKKRTRAPKDPSRLGASDFVTSRITRVAKGCGRESEDVRELIGRFLQMREMFGMLGQFMGGGGGLLGKIPGMGKLNQLNAMRKMAKDPAAMQQLLGGGGGMPGMGGGLPGMGGGLPGMGGGLPGMPGMGNRPSGGGPARAIPTTGGPNKAKRKRDKAAKRKNRR